MARRRNLTVNWRSKKITRALIEEAFQKFDSEYRGKEPDCGNEYVIIWRKKRYPPKRILELASGIPVAEFNGGSRTNDVFLKLGYSTSNNDSFNDTERCRLEARCPSLAGLSKRLLSQPWTLLGSYDLSGGAFKSSRLTLKDGHYPGVYVLAFREGSGLSNKPILVEDIYYVGMSSIGVATRLGQFRAALRNGHGHSAGKRVFLMDDAKKADKSFFVASISIPCRFRKEERVAADLYKLGTVAALEWHMLGIIKDKHGREPSLNKK